jgi:hypothetical protein
MKSVQELLGQFLVICLDYASQPPSSPLRPFAMNIGAQAIAQRL